MRRELQPRNSELARAISAKIAMHSNLSCHAPHALLLPLPVPAAARVRPRNTLVLQPLRYAERDLHLYRLSDADLQAEYARYTTIYLADETIPSVRGMAEMTVRCLT
jgi:hypothetical protein